MPGTHASAFQTLDHRSLNFWDHKRLHDPSQNSAPGSPYYSIGLVLTVKCICQPWQQYHTFHMCVQCIYYRLCNSVPKRPECIVKLSHRKDTSENTIWRVFPTWPCLYSSRNLLYLKKKESFLLNFHTSYSNWNKHTYWKLYIILISHETNG